MRPINPYEVGLGQGYLSSVCVVRIQLSLCRPTDDIQGTDALAYLSTVDGTPPWLAT